MEYSGLARKYPVNRPLTDQELELRLDQKKRLDVEPAYQLSVIRMNSTFMELVDKYFGWKGFFTTFLVIAMVIVVGMSLAVSLGRVWSYLLDLPSTTSVVDGLWVHEVGFFVVFGVAPALLGTWLLRKESFAYTHYPIRLNRKTRMVHVFRLNGTVLSVPWNEVFFCLAALPQRNWEIQGHVIDKDGVTVRETFPFMLTGTGAYERDQNLPRYWEFVRRYMEEGPAPLLKEVKICLPIADRRETFGFGLHRTHFDVGAIPLILQAFILLTYIVTYPGRWFAMRTSKIPQWPKEIDDQCLIEQGDLYVRDASTNPDNSR